MIAESYCVVNYRTGNMRLLKRRPQYIGPYEVMCQLRIEIAVPITPPIYTVVGKIEMPTVSLFEVVLEEVLE